MGWSCYTSAGGYVLEQRWQFRQQQEQDQQLGLFCSQSSRLSLSSGEDWLHVRSGRDGSSRQIKLFTRVRVLNKRVATCPGGNLPDKKSNPSERVLVLVAQELLVPFGTKLTLFQRILEIKLP